MKLTQKRLKEVLDYDPKTGMFRWKLNTGHKKMVGKIAGVINAAGYRVICVDKNRNYAHRIAFLWMNGKWPKKQVDHIDSNRGNNSWKNLREASNMENCWNCSSRRKTRRSKFKGLWFWEKRQKWQVKIKYGKKVKTLGYFVSEVEAAKAYDSAAEEFHGKFACLNFPRKKSV